MNKVIKPLAAICALLLCVLVWGVQAHAQEILPDFVVTDMTYTPEVVHPGETVLVTALVGNIWPLAIDEIDLMDVEVAFVLDEEIQWKTYRQTGCTNKRCPPDIPGAPCANYSMKCPSDPGFEWDVVKCQWMPPYSECRCVYFVEVWVELVIEEPGVHTVGFVADPDNLIVETNLENNSQFQTIVVCE